MPAPTGTAVHAPAKADPEQELYKALRTASLTVDASLENLEKAMQGAKALAPKAGGDAKTALEGVAGLLDSAGEALSDYDDVPDTFEEFKKDFAASDDRRLKGIAAATEALKDTNQASDILNGLAQNVPEQHKAALQQIADSTDEAAANLEDAIKAMGGTVSDAADPGEEAGDSSAGSPNAEKTQKPKKPRKDT